ARGRQEGRHRKARAGRGQRAQHHQRAASRRALVARRARQRFLHHHQGEGPHSRQQQGEPDPREGGDRGGGGVPDGHRHRAGGRRRGRRRPQYRRRGLGGADLRPVQGRRWRLPCEVKPPAFEGKVRPPDKLARWIAELPRPLVFTNGVFDILHRGHATYLARARELGAALLVALNGDASARRLGKGAERPLNALADRMALVAALEPVSAVTWFDEDTPERLIAACRPEVLVKGGDWAVERIAGARSVLERGGRVLSIPFEHERSTTALVQRIRGTIQT